MLKGSANRAIVGSGDITANNTDLFDKGPHSGQSGSVFVIEQSVTASTDYGASYVTTPKKDIQATARQQMTNGFLKAGHTEEDQYTVSNNQVTEDRYQKIDNHVKLIGVKHFKLGKDAHNGNSGGLVWDATPTPTPDKNRSTKRHPVKGVPNRQATKTPVPGSGLIKPIGAVTATPEAGKELSHGTLQGNYVTKKNQEIVGDGIIPGLPGVSTLDSDGQSARVIVDQTGNHKGHTAYTEESHVYASPITAGMLSKETSALIAKGCDNGCTDGVDVFVVNKNTVKFEHIGKGQSFSFAKLTPVTNTVTETATPTTVAHVGPTVTPHSTEAPTQTPLPSATPAASATPQGLYILPGHDQNFTGDLTLARHDYGFGDVTLKSFPGVHPDNDKSGHTNEMFIDLTDQPVTVNAPWGAEKHTASGDEDASFITNRLLERDSDVIGTQVFVISGVNSATCSYVPSGGTFSFDNQTPITSNDTPAACQAPGSN